MVQKTYTFNPSSPAIEDNIIPPRPANINLTAVEIFAGAGLDKPEDAKLLEKYQKLGRRNERQRRAIAALPPWDPEEAIKPLDEADATHKNLTAMFAQQLDWAYRCYHVSRKGSTLPAEISIEDDTTPPIKGFQKYIYLYNVIVAFEWQPNWYDLTEIERAVTRAADFLFDVTDGWMTFGQVVIGGPILLSCADVQVLASNRLHPRVWVGGLHEAAKYVPIRLGRGLWQKNNRVSIPWDEPEGYRLLIHEWGHYALELIDAYVETHQVYIPGDVKSAQGPNEARRSNRELVVSSISQPVDSIMARLEGTSELVPKREHDLVDGKFQEWKNIIDGYLDYGPRYPRIKTQPRPIEGPLPLQGLPHVVRFQSEPDPANPTNIDPKNIRELLLFDIPLSVNPEHCWVYVLKYDGSNLDRVIAQGTLDNRLRNGFRLLGAAKNDQVVLIGDTSKYEPVILRGTIAKTKNIVMDAEQIPQAADPDDYSIREYWRLRPGEGDALPWRMEACIGAWEPWTPKRFPLIDILPQELSNRTDPAAMVRVQILKKADETLKRDTNPQIHIVPLDQVAGTPGGEVRAFTLAKDPAAEDFSSSEVVSLDGHVFAEWKDTGELMIASYSQGGGPPTGSPVNGAPITAGSADGNLMIFFEGRGEYAYKRGDHAEVRVITTRQPGIAPDLAQSTEPGAQPRGYAFSLGSNGPLPLDYKPTMAIAYDRQTELDDGEPVIHRLLDTGQWQPIPSYRPRGAWYVAAPLNEETAPRLTQASVSNGDSRVERFRIFVVPQHANEPATK